MSTLQHGEIELDTEKKGATTAILGPKRSLGVGLSKVTSALHKWAREEHLNG